MNLYVCIIDANEVNHFSKQIWGKILFYVVIGFIFYKIDPLRDSNGE